MREMQQGKRNHWNERQTERKERGGEAVVGLEGARQGGNSRIGGSLRVD